MAQKEAFFAQVDFVSGLTRSQFEEVPGMGAKFDKMRQRLHKI
eukprot:COSAG06_NODE_45089_length_357_cov_2.965116_2_plen_42_part_01